MKYSFKILFNIIIISLISMVLFLATWFIGRAVTGSWNIGEWNNNHNTEYSIVSEDNCAIYENIESSEFVYTIKSEA